MIGLNNPTPPRLKKLLFCANALDPHNPMRTTPANSSIFLMGPSPVVSNRLYPPPPNATPFYPTDCFGSMESEFTAESPRRREFLNTSHFDWLTSPTGAGGRYLDRLAAAVSTGHRRASSSRRAPALSPLFLPSHSLSYPQLHLINSSSKSPQVTLSHRISGGCRGD